ncbi:MAG: hypothetical protein ABH950_03660 [Candidatus Altiarchaeota archaeon]
MNKFLIIVIISAIIFLCGCIEQTPKEVFIKTDKLEYGRGEEVIVTLHNGLSKSIVIQNINQIYGNNARLENKSNKQWEKQELVMLHTILPIKELMPGDNQEYLWDQKILDEHGKIASADVGRYRIMVSYADDQLSAFERREVFSNEFELKVL